MSPDKLLTHGNSQIRAHVWSEIGNLVNLSQLLFRSTAGANLTFIFNKRHVSFARTVHDHSYHVI